MFNNPTFKGQTFDLFSEPSVSSDLQIPFLTVDEWTEWRNSDARILNYPDESGHTALSLLKRSVDSLKEKIVDGYSCAIGYSGGKDSNLTVYVFLLSCMELVREGRGHLIQPSIIFNSNTRIENPETKNLAYSYMAEFKDFCALHGIPLDLVTAQPSLAMSWVGKILGGRGIPVFVNANSRDCAIDWKVNATKTAVNNWIRSLGYKPSQFRKTKLLTLLGSRLDESAKRKLSLEKFDGDDVKVSTGTDGSMFLYPILHFSTEQLWAVLTRAGVGGALPSPVENFDELFEFYSESASGDCPIVQDTAKAYSKSGACSSRSGCILCTAVANDKSLENMLINEPDKYGYMKHLNQIQRVLVESQYNWDLRNGVGRTLYKSGHIELKSDTYRIGFLKRLLHGLISADFLEQRRAAEHSRKFYTGELKPTPRNKRMCEPQFQFIEIESVIFLDFLWSLHGYCVEPFEALGIWESVYKYGELELFDDKSTLTRTRTPRKAGMYLEVCSPNEYWDSVLPSNQRYCGLVDQYQNAFNCAETNRVYDRHSNEFLEFTNIINEENNFTIDKESAFIFLDFELERYRNAHITPQAACQVLLNFGVISLSKSSLLEKHYQAIRGSVFYQMGLNSNKSLDEIFIEQQLERPIRAKKSFKAWELEPKRRDNHTQVKMSKSAEFNFSFDF